MYCEVQGRTLVFHMQNGEQLESVGSMDDLSGQLAKYNNFLRAHRSYLVNMEYIKTISSKAILMVNQDEIPVPHGKCSEIKNQYLEYAFSKDQVVLACGRFNAFWSVCVEPAIFLLFSCTLETTGGT